MEGPVWPAKCYGVLGVSLSEITLYSGHTSALPKLRHNFPHGSARKQCLKQLFARAKILTSELSLSIFILSFDGIPIHCWLRTERYNQTRPSLAKSNLRVSNNTPRIASEAQQANCPE